MKSSVRLSKFVIPKKYKISLAPNLANFTFSGKETIDVELLKSTKQVVLHSVDLKIKAANAKVSYNKKTETATLTFIKALPKGNHKLKLEFEGILNDQMRGFYRSKYLIGKKEYHMAVTQFESTDARRAIPSFDEPDKKAVFEIELIVPNDHIAISNTIETEVLEHENGYKTFKFSPSPKMSSYLLAFIVGKFEHIEKKTKSGVRVRVFVTPGKKSQADFALSTAAKILDYYENYFGIKFPLPVLDLIAIPDFASGAMENWGAVTYRETALLVDEKLSSTANKQWVALVIAHELAHMWFGNLVTMEWWTHLWLNEGFASFIEYLAVDHIFPKWKVWTQFVFMDHARALELDGLENTHPIEIEVLHPKDISEIFDAVSYSKGASIIRMLASYLGEKDFQKGLQFYLKKHKFANAKTEDLWKALEKISGKPVGKVMKNWTGKPGYPLIGVSRQGKKIILEQKRFFSSPISANKTKDKTLWSIPVDFISDKKIPAVLLNKKSISINVDSWIKINPGETSFIRVNYQPELLETLSTKIDKLSTEDRFGLIRDTFSLAQSGQIKTSDVLKLMQSYKGEEEYIVWTQIISNIVALNNLFSKEKFYEDFRAYSRELLSGIVEKVGWEKEDGEEHGASLLRPMALSAIGKMGDKATIEKAKKLFKNYKNLDPDLRGVVYSLVAENGEETEYKKLMSMYLNEPMQEEKDRIFRALCFFKDKKLIKQTLDFAFSDKVRSQDQFKAISFVFGNSLGKEIAWEYVKRNWKIIAEKFQGGHLYSRFIQPAALFTDKKYAVELEKFFKKESHEGLERTIAQIVEQIYSNDLWINRDRKSIADALKNW